MSHAFLPFLLKISTTLETSVKKGEKRGSGERGKPRPSGRFERDATVSTLPVPDVHPAKREESSFGSLKNGLEGRGLSHEACRTMLESSLTRLPLKGSAD